VALINAPEGFDLDLPAGAVRRNSLRGSSPLDVVLLFCRRERDLTQRFETAKGRVAKDGGLWVCWPKKSSGVPTDLGDAIVRTYGLESGLVDNKVCAIDDTWSALRFVWRTADR
jgi:hypothetical protein